MGFPKFVYKSGTGKKVGEDAFTAESALVKSAEELAELGAGWVESPAEAGLSMAGLQQRQPVNAEEKPAKKVK